MSQRGWVGVVAAGLLAAGAARAQSPQPTGMMSPTRPFYLTNDGVPDGNGDVPGTIQLGSGNITPITVDFGTVPCNGQTQFFAYGQPSLTGGKLDQFSRGGNTEVTAGNFDSSDPSQPRPTNGHYDELGAGGPVQGDFDLIDSNGDHLYERAQVLGNNNSGPVQADLDFVPADVNGDGFPDYLTLTSLAPFNFFGMNCDVAGTPTDFDQLWLPLARDLDGDFAIIGDLDGNSEADPQLAWGPKLALARPLSTVEVPTMSGLGLAALSLVLLGLGVHLLRRREPAAGG